MIAPDAQGHKLFQSSIAGEWTIVDGRAVYAPAHGSSAQAGRVELSFLGPKIVFAEYGLAVIWSWSLRSRSGTETMTYVRNIYKYYVAYKLRSTRSRKLIRRVRGSRTTQVDSTTNQICRKTLTANSAKRRCSGKSIARL